MIQYQKLYICIVLLYISPILCDSEKNLKMISQMEGHIVHGEPVPIEKYPHSVLIYNMGSMCGGSIINSWVVLSAAHCFIVNDDEEDITIHVGTTHRDGEEAVVHTVSLLNVHEKFNEPVNFANDIALVFVYYPFVFNKKVQKAILAVNEKWLYEDPTKHIFVVAGWGRILYDGPLSNQGLMMTQLKFVPTSNCSRIHSITMSPDMFCLYGDGERDTCQGDSGGGVFWHNTLIGIVSHGDGCAGKDKPSVYTNVFKFRNWIEQKVEDYYKFHCTNNVNDN